MNRFFVQKYEQYLIIPITGLLLFAPLASGSVQGWAIGVIFLVILMATAQYIFSQKQNNSLIPATPLNKPILVVTVLALCSLIFSVHPYTSIIAVAQLSNYLLFYYLVLYSIKERSIFIFLVYWIIGISTFICIVGLLSRCGVYPFAFWDYSDSSYPQSWLCGTFVNHSHMAGWLEMSIPLLLCLIIFGCQKKWLILQLSILLLQGVCLILTMSRGGWIAASIAVVFIICWLFYFNFKGIRAKIVVFSILFTILASGLLLTSTDISERLYTAAAGFEGRSIADRMIIWGGAVDMIFDNWLIGTGPGTFSVAFPGFQPPGFSHRFHKAHNDYLQFIAELGIGMSVIILWVVIILYRYGLKKTKSQDKLITAVTLGSLAGITSILIHSIVDFNLHIPANALLFSALFAFVMRLECQPYTTKNFPEEITNARQHTLSGRRSVCFHR